MHRATGAEIHAFYETGLPDGFDWKETAIPVYDMEWAGDEIVYNFLLDPLKSYNLRELGTFRPSDSSAYYFNITFEEAFVKWKKLQQLAGAPTASTLETVLASSQPRTPAAEVAAQEANGPEDFHHPHAA